MSLQMVGDFQTVCQEKLLCKLVPLPPKSVQVKDVVKASEKHLNNLHVNCKANADAKWADRPATLELFYHCSNYRIERELLSHEKGLKGNHTVFSNK